MAFGAGKYDDILTEVREKVGATAALLVIHDGNKGPGFSCQAPLAQLLTLPQLLRDVADAIEADIRKVAP